MTIEILQLPPVEREDTTAPSPWATTHCASCGSQPGDGYTPGCFDESGCGYFKLYMAKVTPGLRATGALYEDWIATIPEEQRLGERILLMLYQDKKIDSGRYSITIRG